MSDSSSETRWDGFSDTTEAELPDYKVLSGLAVVGFILSLLSVLAVVHVALSFLAAAAALCCVVALVRIASAPTDYSGRGLAVAGLFFAVFFAVAGVARAETNLRLYDLHSRDIALQWFEFLKQGEPEKALELESSASVRRPLDDNLLDHYLSSQIQYEGLQGFVGKPEVRAVLALGDEAEVRHYACEETTGDEVDQVFAVTYEEAGTKKSFLVGMTLIRDRLPDHGVAAWRTGPTDGPLEPESLR